MFMVFYQSYRTLSMNTTISFSIMSAALFMLFRPKPHCARLRMGHYVVLGDVSFNLLFQGVLLYIIINEMEADITISDETKAEIINTVLNGR